MFTPQTGRFAQEFAQRQCMAVKLFRPVDYTEEFFRCRAAEILVRGGNRSSKTTSCAVATAACALDIPITFESGVRVEMRTPAEKREPMVIWIVGLKSDHIGQTIHRMLFRSNAFKIIRDAHTGLWRSWRPWDAADASRESETRPAPPLIPASYIKPKSWAWENKAQRVFSEVSLWDPKTERDLATIYAYSSTGDVKAGDAVNRIWIDERIQWPEHYPEWQARLIDKNGILYWSTWPDTTNRAVQALTQRARSEALKPEPAVKEFVWKTRNNKYLTEKAQQRAISSFGHDAQLALSRLEGEYADAELKSYPRFNRGVHSAISWDAEGEDKVSAILRKSDGLPPREWTKYLVLDPGTSHPAVLLLAVPPPALGEYLVAYDEVYPGRADPDQLAKIVANRTQGQWFQRFIIDGRAARQTSMAGMRPVMAEYADHFRKNGLKCIETGSTFIYGSDDVPSRMIATNSMLAQHEITGLPRLRIVIGKCPNLVQQLEDTNKQQRSRGEIVEFVHAPGQKLDLVHCLEYGVSRAVSFYDNHPMPQWHAPPEPSKAVGAVSHMMDEIDKLFTRTKPSGQNSLWLGPPRTEAA